MSLVFLKLILMPFQLFPSFHPVTPPQWPMAALAIWRINSRVNPVTGQGGFLLVNQPYDPTTRQLPLGSSA